MLHSSRCEVGEGGEASGDAEVPTSEVKHKHDTKLCVSYKVLS